MAGMNADFINPGNMSDRDEDRKALCQDNRIRE